MSKKRAKDYWDRFLSNDVDLLIDFFNKELSLEEKKKYFKEFVEVVNIETSSACNRTCNYCPVSIIDRKSNFYLSQISLDKVIDELVEINYNNNISLNLYNEPLKDEMFVHKLHKIIDKLPQSYVIFNTNGDYLKEKLLSELINTNVSEIRITLHSDKAKYDLESQLKRYRKFFKQINRSDLLLTKEIRIDLNGNMILEVNIQNSKILIMSNNWQEFGNDRGGKIKELSLKYNRTSPCMKPIREFTIGFDSNVYPCCQIIPDESNKDLAFSNIQDKSIFDAYFNTKLNNFRKSLIQFGEKTESPCNTCRDYDNSSIETKNIRSKIICQ
jgi:MoaA/NifB/PqqE/SkfB family radical SAM enzyme